MLRVEMLSTGDEVLHGQIIDTNAAWLADYLFQQGMPMSGRETVGDSLSSLIETLQERSHMVIPPFSTEVISRIRTFAEYVASA
ncbi:CinA-like protein [Serratia liquefaciens]|nr:CinA-like protein [Serratia liquefaciens]